MLAIHPQARTTPAVRREIAGSREPSGVLAARYGISPETVRKWRQRGVQDCQDRSSRPTNCPGKPQRRSGRSSVRCAAPPAFRSMI
jgi:transposase-like protein